MCKMIFFWPSMNNIPGIKSMRDTCFDSLVYLLCLNKRCSRTCSLANPHIASDQFLLRTAIFNQNLKSEIDVFYWYSRMQCCLAGSNLTAVLGLEGWEQVMISPAREVNFLKSGTKPCCLVSHSNSRLFLLHRGDFGKGATDNWRLLFHPNL